MHGRLEIRLLNYFLLIAMAAVMIGIEFYFEMSRVDLNEQICKPVITTNHAEHLPLSPFRNKIVIMFVLLTIVVAIVLMMFIRNITMPLQKMANVAGRINNGDLSQIVPVETSDEIGQVGIAINELTSNLQEVASYTAATTNQALDKISQHHADNGQIILTSEEMEDIKESLNSLIAFVEGFTLLHTDISS